MYIDSKISDICTCSSLENGNHVSKIQFEEDEKVIKIGIVEIPG